MSSLAVRKLDLHVHTSASHDFQTASSTPLQDVVDQAKTAGLDGLAVTDHNSVAAIDEMKKLGKASGLAVFPGMEISCGGAGEGPIHVIGLFDVDKTQQDLERVLGALGMKGTGENALTTKSVSDVINIIATHDGLPVLAHANSTHGALSDIKGNPRTAVVKNPHLIAVEATDADFAKPVGRRLVDILDGTDTTYRRELAVYRASDNPDEKGGHHIAQTVGSYYTYFWMGALTLESLRQCFEDRETRIVQSHDADGLQIQQPRLLNIEVSGGFLDGLTLDLHAGMNSIIGSTGTGKSLLIEFMRFLFGKPPQTSSLLTENRDKLDKQLRPGGTVSARFVDASGDEYEVSRTFTSSRKAYESPIVCRNCTSEEDFSGDINSVFPLLIYSQNEILEITRDPRAQLNLLDNFRNFDGFRRQIATIHGELKKLDQRLIASHRESLNLQDLKKQAATLDAKIKKCEKKLKAKVPKEFASFKALDAERTKAKKQLSEFDAIVTTLDELLESLASSKISTSGSVSLTKSVATELAAARSEVEKQITKARTSVASARGRAERQITVWERANKLASVEKQYRKALALKEKIEEVESERTDLVDELEGINDKIESATAAAGTLTTLRKERVKHLRQLQATRAKYFAERDAQAKLVTQRSGDKLRLEITQATDAASYRANLLKVKVGSHAEEKEVDSIIANLPVGDFVELVLDRNASALAKAAKLTEAKAENIVAELLKPENLPNTLALQYESYPEDAIAIRYRKQDGQHYPLATLSMGQKADALVMIALGDSTMPVIIDQPEDALDISSIWDDVCTRLRTSKHARQFIFTTHNSSIAVASDSDQFIAMNADASKGWIDEVGSIDQKKMKDKVVGHLEGGYDSYHLKRRKYGL